jgi:hypothetical protein
MTLRPALSAHGCNFDEAQGITWNPGEPQVNYSQFGTIQKIKKSAAAIRKEEKELAKREKALAEKQLLVQRLGLNENVEAPTVRASAEAVNFDASKNCGNEGEA